MTPTQFINEPKVDIVNGRTDAEVISKPPWKERKQQYIERMRHVSPQVRRVSMADKLHNARSILADYHRGEKKINICTILTMRPSIRVKVSCLK